MFVPLAEEGWFDKSATLAIAQEYLAPLKRAKIDTLILGCTHYPLLKWAIAKSVGKNVILVDSAKAVAEMVKALLTQTRQTRVSKGALKHTFLISDRPQKFQRIAANFLGGKIKHIIKVSSCLNYRLKAI